MRKGRESRTPHKHFCETLRFQMSEFVLDFLVFVARQCA